MSYHIYTTPGIILKRTPFGEANIMLHVLTRDLGLIIASARSARLSVSKLRSALQEYTYVSLSCIKGKNGWKITNVVENGSFFYEYPEYSHVTMAQVASVLMKMIPGESPHPEIFETIESGFEFLESLREVSTPDFEVLIVLRILYQLGYVVINENTEIFLKNTTEWNELILQKIKENKVKIIGLINKALKESQL
ncbi:MAG: recombination protein O N-terminal domain-containing protein [Minisyncoccia bacterium]